jgi:sarcosine oxidase subunit beta
MTSASVVVVGAGVVGASVAYHLAARGWQDIRVLERSAAPGDGSTRLATGGYRSLFATPINVRLSLLARAKLKAFPDEIGIDPGYRATGYLWLATNHEQMKALRRVQALHVHEGQTDAAEIDAAAAAQFNPAVDLSEVRGGVFCSSAGFVEPMRILDGYLAAARRLGVRLECDSEVVGFRRDANGRIQGVLTRKEVITAEFIINAAGPWAAPLAALAGVELPVTPLRRQVAVTNPFDGLPEDMPMTIFLGDGFHLRMRSGRALLLLPAPGVPGSPYDTAVDPAWISAVYALARRRVPALRRTVIDESACYAGLYEMSPDKHALLGAAPGCENLLLVNGSSGHGVMHAPALGQLVAEILTDGSARSLDIEALRPSRFAEGNPNPTDSLL